ncbi:AAA family ATPase [Streptomyces sp. H27-D2]|uniref:AAA family ATPase n=1 Tax=Streptomyces sp. H27-D2 TaxID=3046304 RepID=UPI002DB81E7E|nr:AAA family ATPase [Streptomyces sp. H27-D2]MEC4020645.1 AAA family ATPase [Streptomyces sp. H27-D2]
MLLRFRAANVRSLRDEQELSFVVPEGVSSTAMRELTLAGDRSAGVFPLIGIFGANASGKSNVLAALTDMREAVLNSYARWGVVRRHRAGPVRAGRRGGGRTEFLRGGSRDRRRALDVRLRARLGSERVEAEWLHSYPRGHRQVWLDRDASRAEVYEWPGSRVKDRAQLTRRTRPNALLLSTAGTDSHPQLSPLFHWSRRNLWLINPEDERAQREAFTTKELSGSRARRINELLKVADLGITGAEVVEEGGNRATVKLTHRSATAFHGYPAFMRTRSSRPARGYLRDFLHHQGEEPQARSGLSPLAVAGDADALFYVGLDVLDAWHLLVQAPDDSGESTLWLLADDQKSWAAADYVPGDGEYVISQYGPRRLWDEAERSYRLWAQRGRPERDRAGLSVTHVGQRVWLDTLENVIA